MSEAEISDSNTVAMSLRARICCKGAGAVRVCGARFHGHGSYFKCAFFGGTSRPGLSLPLDA